MTSRDAKEYPSADRVATNNGHNGTTASSTKLIDPPQIPVGLPHIVQFVEGFLFNESQTVQNVGSKMARYADESGLLSISLAYLCLITGLGSHHTVSHAIEVMMSIGLLEKVSGQGGNDRKSNQYRFLGEECNWKPPKAIVIPLGTHLRSALRKSLEENELLAKKNDKIQTQNHELQAQLSLLNNGPCEVTNDTERGPADSYESGEVDHEDRTIRHCGVTDREDDPKRGTASHSYETDPSGSSLKNSGAIGHSKVTDDSDGQAYLARRARVEALVMEFRDHYARSFRGGVSSAVHHFSLNPDNERDLLMQVETLRADREATAAGPNAPPATEDPAPSGRREVEPCPDCDRPFTTHCGAEYCPECTERRRRGGG